ncbi:MAG: hydrogenase maturation protease [Anaerolineales bacterium]|nr:hydrogenase maturation protease [Anaerolineales bacterium]
MNIAVIGIGQSLRGDDGIGPEAVRHWSADHSPTAEDPQIHVMILETPGLGLLDDLETADSAVLVDAVSTGRPAGTIRVFDPIPDTSLSAAEKTAHGFGVAESISVARKTGARLPQRLILIGIEGGQYELGRGLSDSVSAALPVAAEKIQEIVLDFLPTKPRPGSAGRGRGDTKQDLKNTKDGFFHQEHEGR